MSSRRPFLSFDFFVGSQYPNTSATVFIVACSLEASNYTSNLEIQSGDLEPTLDQLDAPSQAWSLFENGFGTQLDLMVFRRSFCSVDLVDMEIVVGVIGI